jgi:DNA-binding PucR family transcriptional regulator
MAGRRRAASSTGRQAPMTSAGPATATPLDQLLAQLAHTEQMRAFSEARLGRVREYDRAHGAQLMRTLDAYFAAGRSLSAAAARLHTHRNTVLYRLRRIEALTQARLRDPRVELELQLALRIAVFLDG